MDGERGVEKLVEIFVRQQVSRPAKTRGPELVAHPTAWTDRRSRSAGSATLIAKRDRQGMVLEDANCHATYCTACPAFVTEVTVSVPNDGLACLGHEPRAVKGNRLEPTELRGPVLCGEFTDGGLRRQQQRRQCGWWGSADARRQRQEPRDGHERRA